MNPERELWNGAEENGNCDIEMWRGIKEDLNCSKTIDFEIICTKKNKMSKTTKPLRGNQDESNRVVKNWGESEGIRKANRFRQGLISNIWILWFDKCPYQPISLHWKLRRNFRKFGSRTKRTNLAGWRNGVSSDIDRERRFRIKYKY